METSRLRPTEERYYRDDDFYVARPEDDRETILSKGREVLRNYPLLRACVLFFVLAFALRALYNLQLGNYPISPELRDMHDYDQVARSLVDGGGYSRPWAYTDDRGETVVEMRKSMFRPPLYTLTLASAYALSNRDPLVARILLCSIGASTVVAVFLVTRKLFNTRVGAVAGILAALYPSLIAADGVLYPEALFTLLAVLLVLSLLLLKEKVTLTRAAITGALVGALALTRAEGAVWILLPLLFVAVSMPAVHTSRKVGLVGVMAATAFVVYLPWLHHTWTNFKTVAPSASLGSMVVGANNRVAYYDRVFMGSWYYGGLVRDRATLYEIRDPRHNEKTVDDLYLAQGLEYARSHLERLPSVVVVRVLRGFDFWDPYVTARLEEGWGRPMWVTYAGMALYFPLLGAGIYGLWRSRRRWRDFLPFYTIVAGFVVFSALAFGSSRFRLPADVSLIVVSSSVLYGITRTTVLTRRTSLGDLLDSVEEAGEMRRFPTELPEEVRRAIRLRAAKERAYRRLHSEDLARLHEGEDLSRLDTESLSDGPGGDAGIGDAGEAAPEETGTVAETEELKLTETTSLDIRSGLIRLDREGSEGGLDGG